MIKTLEVTPNPVSIFLLVYSLRQLPIFNWVCAFAR